MKKWFYALFLMPPLLFCKAFCAPSHKPDIKPHFTTHKRDSPYFRGLINEIGIEIKTIKFNQPQRKYGVTKNNFSTLYDIAMLGIVKHSRKPLRFMVLIGFLSSAISLMVALFYFIYKLLFWNSFSLGLAPIIIGIFIVSSIQITLLGLVGEYIGIILLHQRNLPLVIEKERINF